MGRQALRAGDSAANGERFRFDRNGGNDLSAAQPVEGTGAGAKRVGGVRCGASAEVLRVDAGRQTPPPGDGRDVGPVLVEHEQVARSTREGEIDEHGK